MLRESAVTPILWLKMLGILGVAVIEGLIHFAITQRFTIYLLYSALLGLPLGFLISKIGYDCTSVRRATGLFCFSFLCSVIVLPVSNGAFFQEYYSDPANHALYDQSALPSNVFGFILFRLQNESRTLISINLSSLSEAVKTGLEVARGGTDFSGLVSNSILMGFELLLLWLFVSGPSLIRVQVALRTGVSYDTVMFVRDLILAGRSEAEIREQLRGHGMTTDDGIARAIRSVRVYEKLKAQLPNNFLTRLLWR